MVDLTVLKAVKRDLQQEEEQRGRSFSLKMETETPFPRLTRLDYNDGASTGTSLGPTQQAHVQGHECVHVR